MIVFTGKGKREVHRVEKLRERLTQWIVSRCIDDYLWQKPSGTLAQRRGAAVFNVSRSIWLDFAIFTRTLCGTRSLQTFSETGDTYGVTGDARPFKRGDVQRYLVAGLDGQMADALKD